MGCCFETKQDPTRTVFMGRNRNPKPILNKVQTTKYTWYSFLPKAIIIQFVRPANFVYLISAILQSIPEISSLTPITAIAPFVFVISMSLVREGYEDYRRYKKDKEINERKATVLCSGNFMEIKWQEIQTGDIIKVKNNETIPADFVLLHSTEENQLCYVETANLDGESNLKAKFAFVEDIKLYPHEFEELRAVFTIDQPNSNLHHFSGFIKVMDGPEKHIDFDNILLRETVLKNTEEAVGVVVYSGYDTKIVQNQGDIETKVSHVERKVNWIQGTLLIILILMATVCAVGFTIYHNNVNQRSSLFYLVPQVDNPRTQSLFIYFSSFLLLTFLIPISLNVSIEIIKGFLGIFLSFDDRMYHAGIDKRCSVNNVSILEELGEIDYVLTDKTGTLTANEMVFKHLAVVDQTYTADFIINNVPVLQNKQQFHKFWMGLVICHDVVCDPDSKEYQGSSPDEVCFINYAKTIGYQFLKRTKNSLQLLIHNEKKVYELLHILPFDSRKRMSVIVRNTQTSQVEIYTKGADSCVFDKSLPYQYKQNLVKNINNYAKHGFRTLAFSYRQIPSLQYEELKAEEMNTKAAKTKKLLPQKQIEEKESQLVEKFESNLKLLGATGIEDRLQDDVPQTIARLQAADIIVMMITGDKLETAENIGYLANFIKKESKVFRIEAGNSAKEIEEKMAVIKEFKEKTSGIPVSLIIEGTSIANIIESPNNVQYGNILNTVSSVIFCRSSPKEKGSIVKFVKQKLGGIVLAIGDGGNDVGMIHMANVGVGIMGKEGNSASAASDFSIGEFKFLDRLVLHHGRWFYYRLSYFFVYYGWKNLIMTLLLFFFMTESAFSAFPGLSEPFITVYNIVIGLVLVLYYSIFEQDINDDQFKPAFGSLPILYKEVKNQDLFSYSRYLIWSAFAVIISIYIYCVTRFSLGSSAIISADGRTGDMALQSEAMAISLTIIVVIVLITDIKMFTWFSTFLVIGVVTILGTIGFFLVENFFQIGRNYHVLNGTTFRFWETVFICVATVYFVKLLLDTVKRAGGQTHAEKILRAKHYQENGETYNGLQSISHF